MIVCIYEYHTSIALHDRTVIQCLLPNCPITHLYILLTPVEFICSEFVVTSIMCHCRGVISGVSWLSLTSPRHTGQLLSLKRQSEHVTACPHSLNTTEMNPS